MFRAALDPNSRINDRNIEYTTVNPDLENPRTPAPAIANGPQ
jgi:hypothetical protein